MFGRKQLGSFLLVVGVICTFGAALTGYTRWALLNSAHFGDRTVDVVRAEPVRDALAEKFTDQLIAQEPQLIAARPLLRSGAASVLAGRASGGIIARAASDLHRAMFASNEPSLVVDLADLAVVIRAYLQASGARGEFAQLAKQPAELLTPIAERSPGTELVRASARIAGAAFALPLLALAAFAGAVAFARDRRRGLRDVGLALMLTSMLVVTAHTILGGVALGMLTDHTSDELARAIFDGYFGGLTYWAFAIGACGALLAAASTTLLGGVHVRTLPRLLWERATGPVERPALGHARSALLIVLGIAIATNPAAALALTATIVGGYLALLGLTGLLSALLGPQHGAGAQPARRGTVRSFAAAALLLPVVTSLAVAASTHPPRSTTAATGDPRACNGDRNLCARRLDQVVLPAVHNANSTAADGYLNANNGPSITTQLNMGVRGLLIDALAGQRNADGVVRTDLTGTTEDLIVAKVGRDALVAAQRLAGRVAFGPISGDKRLYLCHVLCELGATDARDELRRIRDWVASHPRDVLVIFIQDEAPAAMIVDALRDSGLAKFAATLPASGQLPTLGELIDSGRRVVLLAERHAGALWYPLGFPLMQETPFGFATARALTAGDSCAANRGPANAPMLLVNHWVETYPPNPRNADLVNAPKVLIERARRCMTFRHRTATLLAVDFVERGDVVGAARALNRTPPNPEPLKGTTP